MIFILKYAFLFLGNAALLVILHRYFPTPVEKFGTLVNDVVDRIVALFKHK